MHKIFGTNFLWPFLVVLVVKSQLSMTYFPRMSNNFILQRHWMKRVSSSNFKLIATITLIYVKRMSLVLKLVKHRGFDSYKKEVKKEFNETEDKKADADDDEIPLITHVNNMHSIFSNVEVYINNQQIFSSKGLYAHKSYITNNFKGAISEIKGVLHCEGYDFEANPKTPWITPWRIHSFQGEWKCSPDLTDLFYGKLGVDFFTTSELLYPNMKVRIRLIRTRPNFYMISDHPNVSLGIVDCSLYNLRITLKDDYHKKRMDMLAYSPVEYNYLETIAKSFIIPARQNQFIQENNFNNAHPLDVSPWQ